MEELRSCIYCGKQPILMRHFGVYFYECCNVMGSFPGVSTKKQAKDDWNNLYKDSNEEK